MMNNKSRTATEATATAAIAVAAGLAFSGAYLPAAIAALIGVGLFAAYEKFGIDGVSISEEQLEDYSRQGADVVEDTVDDAQKQLESKK